jgi:hypothetical protein
MIPGIIKYSESSLFFEAFTAVAQIFVFTDIHPTREFSATRKCDFERKSVTVSPTAITSGASKNLLTPPFGENEEI